MQMQPHLTARQPVVLTPCEEQTLEAVKNQKRITAYPYYSRIKFHADQEAATGTGQKYVIQRGTKARAFSYATGENKEPGGFRNSDPVATIADTNLTSKQHTISGEAVVIKGIAAQIMPCSLDRPDANNPPIMRTADARLLAALWSACSVGLSLNGGEQRFKLGTLGMVPGAGGLAGGSDDATGLQAYAGQSKNLEFAQNGWPVRSNFMRLPEGLVWMPQGNEDSDLNIVVEVEQTIELFTGGSPENEIADVAFDNAPGNVATAAGYAFPASIAAEIMFFLVGTVIGPRSKSV